MISPSNFTDYSETWARLLFLVCAPMFAVAGGVEWPLAFAVTLWVRLLMPPIERSDGREKN